MKIMMNYFLSSSIRAQVKKIKSVDIQGGVISIIQKNFALVFEHNDLKDSSKLFNRNYTEESALFNWRISFPIYKFIKCPTGSIGNSLSI